MRKLILAVLVVAMTLVACDTEDATNITSTSATLNMRTECDQNRGAWDHGYIRFEIRNATLNQGWFPLNWRRFDCTAYSPSTPIAENVGSLSPGQSYQFRIGVQWDTGEYAVYDADGTKNGSNYDAFITDSNTTTSTPTTIGTGASASVDAGKCTFAHITHWGFARDDAAWSSGTVDCSNVPRSINTNCEAYIKYNDQSGFTAQNSPGGSKCNTRAGSPNVFPSLYALRSSATLIAVLNNKDRKWTNLPNWCTQDRTGDGRARVTCYSRHGG